ncbi:hypothetical protein [Bacillus badius]|uniref:Uncharacterized protein n=1 Tax=Bacillus badius TaxID=1455 RepID=A0ABR5AS64_BACBA|nr:hypothetical protein [Bacillus badius]KIL77601.1 hypothetical protein SD77_1274 [Bacillus badius]MED4716871.1 hypothetical protein [Bacillus badius]
MGKWNEQAAPNNNMASSEIKSALEHSKHQPEFSEELADGGERNRYAEEQKLKR